MKRNSFFPILGLVAGGIAIIFAIVVFATGSITGHGTGTWTSYSYYGGDAYTGIQQAGADTARNVHTLSGIVMSGLCHISLGIGALLLVLGLGLISISGYRLAEGRARSRFEEGVLRALKQENGAEAPAGPGRTVTAEGTVKLPEGKTEPVAAEPEKPAVPEEEPAGETGEQA